MDPKPVKGSSLPHEHRPWSLRRVLIGLLGGALAIALLLMGVSVFYFVSRTEQEAWRGRQAEAAGRAAETVGAFLQRVIDYLALIGALESQVLESDPAMLDELLAQVPALLEVVRLDVSGAVFASAHRDAPLLSNLFTMPQAAWFRQAAQGKLYLGDVQIAASGEPYLIIAVPAPDGGVVAGRLRMQLLWDVVADIQFGKMGKAYVINQQGQIVAHTDPQVALSNISLDGRLEMAALSQSVDNRWHGSYVNFEGSRVVGTTAPVPGTAWVVMTELPQAEALATSRTALAFLVLITFLTGMLVLSVTLRFLEQLVFRPMEGLRMGAEQIGQGDLQYRIQAARQDEIGQVAQAFNAMTGRLRQREEELAARTSALVAEVAERKQAEEALQQAKDELETRVLERTLELSQANERLQYELNARTRAEQRLKTYAARLERSNRELQDFAYVASHDLQEPLRKVQAFGDRLAARYGPLLDETGRDYLERMQNAARRMQALINDLLTYSRVTTRAQPFQAVDLGQVARNVISDLEVRMEEVGGRVEVGDLPTIDADPTQMRQLLQNLIGNALKFHRPNEPPVVEVRASLLDGRNSSQAGDAPDASMCQIMVQDNGIGFDEKYVDRIFQVFQRLHNRSEYEGTGIGLATSRKIVERHGGEITAKSIPGQGSTFIVTLPVRQIQGEESDEG